MGQAGFRVPVFEAPFRACVLLAFGALCLAGGRTGGDGRGSRNEDEHCKCVFFSFLLDERVSDRVGGFGHQTLHPMCDTENKWQVHMVFIPCVNGQGQDASESITGLACSGAASMHTLAPRCPCSCVEWVSLDLEIRYTAAVP